MTDSLQQRSNPPLEASRWLMAAVMILGMAAWWWSGYRSWGSMLASVVLMLALWMLHRIIVRDIRVEGNPFYLALVGPLVLLAYHHVTAEMRNDDPSHMTGAMDLSLILQLNLLAAGVLLSQHLLPQLSRSLLGVGGCSVAMLTGAGSALLSSQSLPGTPSHAWTLSGLAGAGMALLGVLEFSRLTSVTNTRKRPREWKIILAAFAVLGTALMVGLSPRESLLGGAIVGTALLACGALFKRWRLLAAGALLGGASVGAMKFLAGKFDRVTFPLLPGSGGGVFGSGGGAMLNLEMPVSGTILLARTIGWAGLGSVLLGLLLCAILFAVSARRLPRERQLRAILWVVITALGLGALFAPGGLFVPSVLMLVAFTVGMLPTVLERQSKLRPDWLPLIAFVVLAVQLGMARNMGLGEWSVRSLHTGPNEDMILHGSVGLLVAIGMAWVLCRRRWIWGVAGIVVAGLSGGLGEALQSLTTYRTPDLMDWLAHATGSAIALPLFLLCRCWQETMPAANPLSPPALPAGKIASVSRHVLTAICWLIALGGTGLFAYCMPGPGEVRSKILMPDFLAAPAPEHFLRGFSNFPDPENTAVACLYSCDQSPPKPLIPEQHRLWAKVEALAPGVHTLHLKALPYGPVAWRSYAATIRIVPPQRPVYLLDAETVLQLPGESPAALRQMIEMLRPHGEVGIFFEGDLFNFEKVFREFQTTRARTPLLYDYLPGKPVPTLRLVAARLSRKPYTARIYVITANPTLAGEAAGRGFATCLYRPINPRLAHTLPTTAPALKEFPTLEAIAEHLRKLNQPPTP